MRLQVENFGPVSKASIETGKLTIFIGKNSTGKSYTAILMKALYTIMLKTLRYSFFLRFKEKYFENEIKEEIKVGLPAFFSTTNLDSLIKWGSKSLSIKFSDKWFNLEIEKEKDGEYKVEFAISKEFYKDFENENIFHSFRKIPYMYYLPASRTGIFESYNVLAAAIINLAPSRIVFGRDIELPGVSPILSEFLSQILLFSRGIKKRKEEKSERVKRIIGGEIVISSKKDRPQILFSQKIIKYLLKEYLLEYLS
jgi:predicted ATPase